MPTARVLTIEERRKQEIEGKKIYLQQKCQFQKLQTSRIMESSPAEREKEVRNMFNGYDINGDNKISVSEMIELLPTWGKVNSLLYLQCRCRTK